MLNPEFQAMLDALRWKKFPVLNDGFVCLVDVMGDESAICQAARVSYQTGTKQVSDDQTLIRYLMRTRHKNTLEMVELQLLVRVPMDTWRQWIRHRTASVNEYSTRYSEAIGSQQTTDTHEWRLQATSNKQGSGEFLIPLGSDNGIAENLTRKEAEFHREARDLYEHRIGCGIAREQARKDLPLSTYTEAYWKIDLHNLLHFLGLRVDSHAQLEIRKYATEIAGIVEILYPNVWNAFRDYRLDAMTLTGLDLKVIREVTCKPMDPDTPLHEIARIKEELMEATIKTVFSNTREANECREKLKQLGLYSK